MTGFAIANKSVAAAAEAGVLGIISSLVVWGLGREEERLRATVLRG